MSPVNNAPSKRFNYEKKQQHMRSESMESQKLSSFASIEKSYGLKEYSRRPPPKAIPVVGCMPGCVKLHKHNYDFDFSKNFKDPIAKRPGYFKEFNRELLNKQLDIELHGASDNVKFATTNQQYNLN